MTDVAQLMLEKSIRRLEVSVLCVIIGKGSPIMWSTVVWLLYLIEIGSLAVGPSPRIKHMKAYRQLLCFRAQGIILSVAPARDGRHVFAGGGGDYIVRMWSLNNASDVRTFAGHTGHVWSIAVSPDGNRMASGGDDQTVRLWDIRTTTQISSINLMERVYAVAISPDSAYVVCGGPRHIRMCNLKSGEEIWSREIDTVSLAFEPNGRFLMSGSNDGIVHVWQVNTGNELRRFDTQVGCVWSIACSPDGSTALFGGADHSVRVWDIRSGRETLCLVGHEDSIRSVSFSPDGRSALSGSWDKTIRLWDLTTGEELGKIVGHAMPVRCVAFLPDGKRIVSGSGGGGPVKVPKKSSNRRDKDDYTIRIWEFD
jgi:WD40 repeat protein